VGEIDHVDLANAVGHLKTADRALVALRFAADLDSPELARFVGLSPSGVRTRLSRLLDRLREELGDD
jgi:DNA-directed RNA polymerase specialized sigma24 family protein